MGIELDTEALQATGPWAGRVTNPQDQARLCVHVAHMYSDCNT